MPQNRISLLRTLGNAAVVVAIALAMIDIALPGPVWPGWSWVIGAVALGYAGLSFAAHLAYPGEVAIAWDEQNTQAYRASLVFGYWAALAVFVTLFIAVRSDAVETDLAFYLMGPILGAAPCAHFVLSVLRGRAG